MNTDEITLTQLAERQRDEKELTAYADGERLMIEISGETIRGDMEMKIQLTRAQAKIFYEFLGRYLNIIEPRATPYPSVVGRPELSLDGFVIDLTGCDTLQKAADAITSQTKGRRVGFVTDDGAVSYRRVGDGYSSIALVPRDKPTS